MRKFGVVVLVVLLVVAWLSAPAAAHRRHHGRHAGFFVGVGIGALLAAPWWWPPAGVSFAYPYPTYPYPVSPYPTSAPYPLPAPAAPAPPPVTESGGRPDAASVRQHPADCQTVQVPGYYQTQTMPDGRHMTAWVPARLAEVCR